MANIPETQGTGFLRQNDALEPARLDFLRKRFIVGWAKGGFAILEDRKWKSAPKLQLPGADIVNSLARKHHGMRQRKATLWTRSFSDSSG